MRIFNRFALILAIALIFTQTVLAKSLTEEKTTEATFYPHSEATDAEYQEGAEYCSEKGYMIGTGKGFDVDSAATRAQLVQCIYAREGKPSTEGVKTRFNDVPEGKWYSNAIKWATANNLISGYGNGKFGPSENVTREEVATVLYKYAEYKGYSLDVLAAASESFASEWAEKQVFWALGYSVLDGTTRGVAEQGVCTRGMLAAGMKAFDENVACI